MLGPHVNNAADKPVLKTQHIARAIKIINQIINLPLCDHH